MKIQILSDLHVVCNPKGYPGEENDQFDPVKCVYLDY